MNNVSMKMDVQISKGEFLRGLRMVNLMAESCVHGELDRGMIKLFRGPLAKGVSACVLGCMLWKERRPPKRQEEDKGSRLNLLWMCLALMRLRGRGTGVIAGVSNWANWWYGGINGNKAYSRGANMMLDSSVFVH